MTTQGELDTMIVSFVSMLTTAVSGLSVSTANIYLQAHDPSSAAINYVSNPQGEFVNGAEYDTWTNSESGKFVKKSSIFYLQFAPDAISTAQFASLEDAQRTQSNPNMLLSPIFINFGTLLNQNHSYQTF